jgi:hypothetical protein
MGERGEKVGNGHKGGNPPFCARQLGGLGLSGHSYAFVSVCTR